MKLSRPARWTLVVVFVLVMLFVYVPLAVVVINSFNVSLTFQWPPPGFTLEWWQRAFDNEGVRSALLTSVVVATIATLIALLLGTLVSVALTQYSFFGRQSISLLIVLPIALPGIVTGVALNTMFTTWLGGLTFATLVIAHATFCVVVIYNNAAARLRRTSGNLVEASMDLGASRAFTFRHVTFPNMRSALVAGAMLAFGLSFDEIIVTTFTAGPGIQTLPLWIFNNLFRPQQAPIVNVVAAALVLVSIIPIYLAQRLSDDAITS
ncbi:MAG: ABC transporter permease [Candidatus Nanopelagicales bacterium]